MNEDQELLHAFRESCREHLDAMEAGVLDLERAGLETSIVDRIFRSTHNLKGDAKVFGLSAIEFLSHEMENVLSLIRNGKLAVNKKVVNTLLRYIDQIRNAIHGLKV